MIDPAVQAVMAWLYLALGAELVATSAYGWWLVRQPAPEYDAEAIRRAADGGGTAAAIKEYRRQRPVIIDSQPMNPSLKRGAYWATTNQGHWVSATTYWGGGTT